MEFYTDNRDFIRNLKVNTGTTESPVFTGVCTASEINLNTDLEVKDFFVFCDALKRKIITGAEMSLEASIKLDANNGAVLELLDRVHTLISAGTISQFNNLLIQFDLLSGISGGVLEYTTYQINTNLEMSDLGGPAEDEADFTATFNFIGKGTEVTSS
jgi:hypothetical protein